MRLVHISDTHGKHRSLQLPPCDFLVCSGDFSDLGNDYEINAFLNWFRMQKGKHKILIGGNHDEDLYFDKSLFDFTGITYLENESVVLEGLKFYGSPRSPSMFPMSWTYYPEDSNQAWLDVPLDVDVLITHCPPKGILDDNQGCEELSAKTKSLIRLKAHLFGHIHQSHGVQKVGDTFYSNAATVINVLEV